MLTHLSGDLFSEKFIVFFEIFVVGKLKRMNLFIQTSSFISKCQIAATKSQSNKMEQLKVNLFN